MPGRAQDDELVIGLVERALTLPAGERESYVRAACADDPELFTQVWHYVTWEERMQGFLLQPLFPETPFESPFDAGDVLVGRFRIVREIAQGGMGVVYEALDEKLDRRIALKCAKPGFGTSLSPEVRNAQEITHPNVCKLFEIHTIKLDGEDIDFLTMEFLEGPTLAGKLQEKSLTREESAKVAAELCAGLAEAHRQRVIHGDLKSGNIILTANRAVITDFGMARQLERPRPGAQSGDVGGTPDYMAPELWLGEKANAASDVYALGVLLCEVLAGRLPYGPEVTMEERRTRRPPPIHPKWDRVLGRCLDPNPQHRFQNAMQVMDALSRPSARPWYWAAAAVLLAAVSAGASYEWSAPTAETVRLGLLPFGAEAPAGLVQQVAGKVGQLHGSANQRFSLAPLRDDVGTLDDARNTLGATHVLRGIAQHEDGNLVLDVFVTDVRSHVDLKEWKARYGPGQERYIPAALAGFVSGALHLPPLQNSAMNARANADYLKGQSYLAYDRGVPDALAAFQQAVGEDSDSPLTYAGLAEAQWFRYFITGDREVLRASAESLRQAELRNPDLAPVHRVRGLHWAESGLYEPAAAEYQRASELEPSNGENYRRLAQVWERNNRLIESLQALQKSVELAPAYYRTHLELGAYYYRRGRYEDAIAPLSVAVNLAPDEANVHRSIGSAYLDVGRFAEAEQALRQATARQEIPAAYNSLGLALFYQGRDGEAIPYFQHALKLDNERYLSWMNLGIVYRRAGMLDQSREANLRGLELAEAETGRNPQNGYVKAILAYLCARLGNKSRAISEVAGAVNLAPKGADVLWMAALTQEALGNRDKTLEVLGTAPPGVVAGISRWPDVADLHADSRFINLLALSRKH